MTKIDKIVYSIFSTNPQGTDILLGNVAAINASDAVLEFVTYHSTDPFDRNFRDKGEASRYLGFFMSIYTVKIARNGDRLNGRPIKVKGLNSRL